MQADGLYINGVWVSDASDFRATYQGNDLTKPDSLQTSYTADLNVPDSLDVRRLTKGAESPDSGSTVTYTEQPAYVRQSGELPFSGLGQFSSFNEGWRFNLREAKAHLYDRLKARSIRTADLTRHDFYWTEAAIRQRAAATDGVMFPLVDYGLMQNNTLPGDMLLPATYLKTVFEQIVYEEGYRVTGLDSIAEYPLMILPFVNETPTNHDAQWIADRQARVTVDPVGAYGINRTGSINTVLPFTVVDNPQKGFSQGKLNNFKPALQGYRCDTAMRVQVNASIAFKSKVTSGGIRTSLILEKNGVEVTWAEKEEGAIDDILFLQTDTMSLDTLVECQAGDVLTLRLLVRPLAKITIYFFECNRNESMWASFAPDGQVRPGDYFPVAANLPDLTGFDLLKLITFSFSGTWKVHERRRELSFRRFTDITKGRAGAVDWSANVDEGQSGTFTPSISPYAKLNRLAYAETDGVDKLYGDGIIYSVAGEAETTLFTMPVAATMPSSRTLTGVDTWPSIPIRVADSNGGAPSSKAEKARVLLAHPSASVDVKTQQKNGSGTYVDVTLPLRLAWFDKRPTQLATEPLRRLDFPWLIEQHYEGLKQILRRPRLVDIYIYLHPSDVASLDLDRLVYLTNTSAGSLRLTNGYYVINKLADYSPGYPVAASLIAL